MKIEQGKKYILTYDWLSGGDRVGQEVDCVLLENSGKNYLAFKDKRGVSWPVNVCHIDGSIKNENTSKKTR